MKPLPDLPNLRILPTESLLPHEAVDGTRIAKLTDAIADDGVLRNPPIVTALPGKAGNFLVLDGANRAHALQVLDIPFVVAQVVAPETDDIRVETWNHAVLGSSSEIVIQRATAGSHITAEQSPESLTLDAAELREHSILAGISDADGRKWQLRCEGPSLMTDHIACLEHLVRSYSGAARIERTNEVHAAALVPLYPEVSHVVVFPEFSVDDVVEVAARGRLFPSGLTRFVVSPRALRLNYPLARLADTDDLDDLQARLRAWIDEMLSKRSIRYYAEATFVFDE